ncbi:MAG: hypothetical protein DWQ44_07100 [Bacteroidetes bacterium]|nr:MAG: hypothetical protein DWQ33_12590 [Bacteroidota bacterium]REJ99783.1 MAG: hypothetical protein DWQ39_12720 [Bacteroidota bacterium]REK34156.1 MAG: hypothetical protein DWQ44_07100 [Bacteroidota bacterium]REK50486.1 MAG: hypothetical protein DWQ48_04010 [Bacteroidota bacterium]
MKRLHDTELLSEVPELIFLNLDDSDESYSARNFMSDFSELSDFIRNKCKLILLSGSRNDDLKHEMLLQPSVVRFLDTPLDAYQLREFIV